MSTVIKPNVQNSTSNTEGVNDWKKLDPAYSQKIRQDTVEEQKQNLKEANVVQDKGIQQHVVTQKAVNIGTDNKANPNALDKPGQQNIQTGEIKSKEAAEKQKVTDKDEAGKAKEQKLMQDNQDTAAKRYVDAQNAHKKLNEHLKTMPKSVDAKLTTEDGSAAVKKGINQGQVTQGKDAQGNLKTGTIGIPTSQFQKGEAQVKKTESKSPEGTKKGDGKEGTQAAKTKGQPKAGEAKESELAKEVARLFKPETGGEAEGTANKGFVAAPDAKASKDEASAKTKKDKKDIKTEKGGGKGRIAYTSDPEANKVTAELGNLFAGVSTPSDETAGVTEGSDAATPVEAPKTEGAEGATWTPPKETLNPADEKYEEVYYAALKNEECVIKPKKEKLTIEELKEKWAADKPLSERIEFEIAETKEKIAEAKGLMQLLIMQMNGKGKNIASGEGWAV